MCGGGCQCARPPTGSTTAHAMRIQQQQQQPSLCAAVLQHACAGPRRHVVHENERAPPRGVGARGWLRCSHGRHQVARQPGPVSQGCGRIGSKTAAAQVQCSRYSAAGHVQRTSPPPRPRWRPTLVVVVGLWLLARHASPAVVPKPPGLAVAEAAVTAAVAAAAVWAHLLRHLLTPAPSKAIHRAAAAAEEQSSNTRPHQPGMRGGLL
jgi:hypothetical protein